MEAAALRPTVTHRVRELLRSQGVEVKPWSGLERTYRELYGLLARRRDDPGFWGPLADLLREIQADALDPESPGRLPAPQAELLASWDVDELVRSLRAALPAEAEPRDPAALARFLSGLSSVVMTGFVVLGLAAAGCDYSDDPNVSLDTWDGACGSAVLQQTLEDSTLSDFRKQELCDCFAGLSESWVGGLEELFESAPPEEIARVLDRIAECWSYGSPVFDRDYQAVEADLLDGELCAIDSQPVYKGVSFLGR
jgi:hypothetical protein